MYIFLLTNYSNYVAFDKALALLNRLKKSNVKVGKRAAFLDNFKMLDFHPYCWQRWYQQSYYQ